MPLKTFAICALGLCMLASSGGAAAESSSHACVLSPDLRSAIAQKYPNTRIVTLADLEADDAAFFRKDHGNDCPGVTEVDFFGDGAPTLALVLAKLNGTKHDTELLVAHKVRQKWTLMLLEAGSNALPYAPVVWSQPPGEYKDVYGERTIRATRPVIVFCKYEGWAIVYAWAGEGVKKVRLSD